MAVLALEADVELALGRDLTAAEIAKFDALVDEAGDLLHGYLSVDYRDADTVPGAVSRVAARVVARSFEQSASTAAFGAESTTDQAGPFSQTLRFAAGSTSGSVWLDAKDKIKLRPFRRAGGFRAIPLEGEVSGQFRTYD